MVERVAALDEVSWAAVVTGRYDIAEVVTTDGMNGLYEFLNGTLQKLGGVESSEVFVVMKATDKWMAAAAGHGRGVDEGQRRRPLRDGGRAFCESANGGRLSFETARTPLDFC